MKKFLLLLITLIIVPINVNAYVVSARCMVVMDQNSHRLLYAKNIHEIRSVASISKVMTAILAIESNKLNDDVLVGDEILGAYGSSIYIKIGETMKLEDLVYGLMLRSGNDSSLAIAKYVGGSVDDFVTMMNKKAKQIGMSNTTFNNPNGLDQEKGNYSTAYDMALLASYAMQNEIYAKIVSTKKHIVRTDFNVYSWTNKNKLLFSYQYLTGGKTGFTEKAKRTLLTTASKDNLNLTIVTLNDGNDFGDHKTLYEDTFNNYKNYRILKNGSIEVYNDQLYDNYQLYLKRSFYYPLNDQEKDSIILKIVLKEKVREGIVGNINVMLGDKNIGKLNIYAKLKETKKNSFIDWIKNLW